MAKLYYGKKPISEAYLGSKAKDLIFNRSSVLKPKRITVPGFVGGWRAYGRSNSEDASTRDILPDYSGNGRDIKLYNFAFSGMSGYGGYAQDFNNLIPNSGTGLIIEQNSTYAKVQNINSGTGYYSASIPKRLWNNIAFRLNVIGSDPNTNPRLIFRNSDASFIKTIKLSEGLNIIEPLSDTEWQQVVHIWFALSAGTTASFELLPLYPGGLVSDGVDDYGQCIKGFSLPNDYTVVALRKIITGNNGPIANKGSASGAFSFEAVSNNTVTLYSYGQVNYRNNPPALFSYQMKGSYNGQSITPGSALDMESHKFKLFTMQSYYAQAVLYDLRIYDHSLTTEELQAVKDEMMSDYEKATGGGIADIHYVADWDGKGRSNDEDEPMRSTWTDRAKGKVIDLHNYAYAGMSGFGGYNNDFSNRKGSLPNNSTEWDWGGVSNPLPINIFSSKLHIIWGQGGENSKTFYANSLKIIPAMRVKVTGMNPHIRLNYKYDDGSFNILSFSQHNSNPTGGIQITKDGVYDLPATTISQISVDKGNGNNYNRGWVFVRDSAESYSNVIIEQLPLYPGALVGDGIDDYGVTQEAINEEVGTMLLHYRRLIEVPTKCGYYYDCINSIRIYAAYTNTSPYFNSNLMEKYNDGNLFIGTTSYTADALLCIMANNSAVERGQVAIFRLIIIREQLDDAQVEFLRWKVEKEYREWCKANGYEYAINQLTA